MKRMLRKTFSLLSVSYSTGNYTNNLSGTEFELSDSPDAIQLSINLGGNLRVRNKESNCYYDACELAEDHELLKSVQIDDEKIVSGMISAHKKNPDADSKLELKLDDKGSFIYSVTPEGGDDHVILYVQQ